MEVDGNNNTYHDCLLARAKEEKDVKKLFPGLHGNIFF